MSDCIVEVNGRLIRAERGETLTDAALTGRVVIPQDCSAGHCGTCRVTVLEGTIDDQGTRSRDTVLACRSRITGPVRIAFDPAPDRQRIDGTVSDIRMLSPGVAQIRVALAKRLVWLTGQYVKLTFRGFPARDLSPTFAVDLDAQEAELVFHMTIHPQGEVSSQLGKSIRVGHKVSVTGPFGSAFLRRSEGALVLASTGTGFAPNFAIAIAARMGQPWRKVTLVAGTRYRRDLYMEAALDVLQEKGAKVILTASDGDEEKVLRLRPQALLPPLDSTDVVHAAGSPSMIAAVEAQALAANAEFHADCFTAAPPEKAGIGSRLKGLLGLGRADRQA